MVGGRRRFTSARASMSLGFSAWLRFELPALKKVWTNQTIRPFFVSSRGIRKEDVSKRHPLNNCVEEMNQETPPYRFQTMCQP